ncbi:hypothetical protein OXV74_16620 [Bacteroides thetaiotaomicron]|nr:hypothetical protein [Bacteroides thetaiotaomicron]
MDRALEILKNHNSFTTERERQQRDILIAAIDNLVDLRGRGVCHARGTARDSG